MQYGRLTAMAIVFAIFPFAPAAFAQQKTKQHQKWEYKIVNYCDLENQAIDKRQHIQQLGEEGWELVSTDPQISGEVGSCSIHYFKRPKGAESNQVTKQQSQQPAAPQCSVPLDKAPTIRGLRLGMSAEELRPLFSTNGWKNRAEDALKRSDSAPNYGLATLWINFYSSDIAEEAKGKLAGIRTISVKALDGRVAEISVTYEPNIQLYPSWTIDEWVAKVSNTFGLPGMNNWELSQKKYGERTLKCRELEVVAGISLQGYRNLPGGGSYHTPYMTITDPSYRQVVEQRVKSDQEKKQREFVF